MSHNDDVIQVGPDINWVSRRYSCNGQSIFDSLRRRIKLDVQRINSAVGVERFSITSDGNGDFVACLKAEEITRRAAFQLSETGIVVVTVESEGRLPPPLKISHKWDVKTATCQLTIDGEIVELWEISQRALGPLFFEG